MRAIGRRRLRAWRMAARNRSSGSTCFYCGVAFEGEGSRRRTVDHRVPRALGGTDGLANLVFACTACNQRKADSAEDDFSASDWLAARRRDVGPPPR
ncbi:MAG TPA: HNH endonuclease signature motif containing protein [Acidimicrobiales bacterium]|nr:HNH endonuclease signature motif containing protein [Acidimicrobiales bacterium]